MIFFFSLLLSTLLSHSTPAYSEYAYVIDLEPVEITATVPDDITMTIDIEPVFVLAPATEIVLNLEPVVVTAPAIDVLYADASEYNIDSVEMY